MARIPEIRPPGLPEGETLTEVRVPDRMHEGLHDRVLERPLHERALDSERSGDGSAQLDPEEKRKAKEEEAVSAGVTHEAIRREGTKELERAPSALAWSGLAAGLSMGLSLVASAALHEGLPDASWRSLVVSFGYPVGFLIVILGSQQLYTENTLTPIVPFMAKPTAEMLRKVLTLWAIVFATNLIGTLLFAWTIAWSDILKPELRAAATAVASEATQGSLLTVFVRGIGAGFIIALLVWMLPGASTERFLAIVVMTWLIAVLGLAHVIVGAAEVFYLAASGERTYADAVTRFIVPSFIGNTVGGVLLVAAVNHAQVAAGKQ
jgi:formate-nitrite transporter family protein